MQCVTAPINEAWTVDMDTEQREADGVQTWDSEPRRFTLDLDYE